jgi:hypothetical protein
MPATAQNQGQCRTSSSRPANRRSAEAATSNEKPKPHLTPRPSPEPPTGTVTSPLTITQNMHQTSTAASMHFTIQKNDAHKRSANTTHHTPHTHLTKVGYHSKVSLPYHNWMKFPHAVGHLPKKTARDPPSSFCLSPPSLSHPRGLASSSPCALVVGVVIDWTAVNLHLQGPFHGRCWRWCRQRCRGGDRGRCPAHLHGRCCRDGPGPCPQCGRGCSRSVSTRACPC